MRANKKLLIGVTLMGLTATLPQSSKAQAVHETVADDDILYAPRPTPVAGNPTIACIGLKFTDTNKTTDCGDMARKASLAMAKNSRGLLRMNAKKVTMKTPYKWRERKRAAYWAMKKVNARYYIVPRLSKYSHGGSKIAWVTGSGAVLHEVGHLVGLGHSGVYKQVKNKNGGGTHGKLISYGDGQSFMSRFASAFIAAPQYYHLGWLPRNEAALFEEGKVYSLKRISRFDEEGLATVIIRPNYFRGSEGASSSSESESLDGDQQIQKKKNKKAGAPRSAFVSFPIGCKNGCVALYLSNGGGSQRIKLFGREYYDEEFTGLHVKNLGYENGKIKVQIDLDPKPASFTNADEGEVAMDDSI